jgi:hypothetical protein
MYNVRIVGDIHWPDGSVAEFSTTVGQADVGIREVYSEEVGFMRDYLPTPYLDRTEINLSGTLVPDESGVLYTQRVKSE